MKAFNLFILGILLSSTCWAQQRFTIQGEMTRDSLRYTPKAITKLYLAVDKDGETEKKDEDDGQ